MQDDEIENKDKVFLDIAWKTYEDSFRTCEHIDAKAYMLLTISALLITLNSTFILEKLSYFSLYIKIGYAVDFVLLIIALIFALLALITREYNCIDTPGFVEEQKEKLLKEIVKTLIGTLSSHQSTNDDINESKSTFVKYGLYILSISIFISGGLIVALLFA
jgi:hypothetical protein